MRKKSLKNAREIVGFGAVQKYGYRLSDREIKTIADYCAIRGGNRGEVENVLKNAGRPFDISDPTFRKTCLLCRSLNNYCCC
ncbi:MAG: hypothetical protein PHH54_01860 [Candidatus Nanoarchaeia archaeon]|nr:hypothetical protein [Candidatus Nanoarchaeia archaeon]MDD5740708.1 hypothetical protein [Candidatus Nanoarchaeia archaeon]